MDIRSLVRSSHGMYVVLAPDLTIIDATTPYARATLTRVDDIRGCGLFDVFPENAANPAADGMQNMHASIGRVLRHRRPDAMALQRHDIRDRIDRPDHWVEKYWSPLNTPLFGKGSDEVVAIVCRVHDVSRFVLRQRRLESAWHADRPRLERVDAQPRQALTPRLWRAVRTSGGEAAAGFGAQPPSVYLPAGAEAPIAGIYEASHTPACDLDTEQHVVLTGSLLRGCDSCGEAVRHRLLLSMEPGGRTAFSPRAVTATVSSRPPRRPRRWR